MPASSFDLGDIATDPMITPRFAVEIGSQTVAYFTEVSGLQAEIEVFDYQEGGLNSVTHKLPVRAKFSNITLKRGVLGTDNRLWDWFKNAMNGQIKREHVSIILFAQDYTVVRKWDLNNAYPVKWVLPSFKAGDSAVSIETLELAYDGFDTG